MILNGATDEDIIDALGVSLSSVKRWAEENRPTRIGWLGSKTGQRPTLPIDGCTKTKT